MNSPITLEQFQELLPSICSKETAAGGGVGWTSKNPLWGHCAVASLIAQNLFGGTLRRVSLENTPFAAARSHYFNCIDQVDEDFTYEQFGDYLPELPSEERTRDYVIGGADTRKRYATLSIRLAQALEPDNPLLHDEIYLACLRQALLSPCQKKGVGAVFVEPQGTIIAQEHNRPIEGLENLCRPTCIRLQIQSRTESMLGACGHAEERLFWNIVKKGYRPFFAAFSLYVAGITSQGLPEKRPYPEFTCLRCAVAMHYAGIPSIYIAYQGKEWIKQTVAEALASAQKYALGTKKA